MIKFGITEDQIRSIIEFTKSILIKGQTIKVWIFGSRARGTHKPYSDIDLLLQAFPQLSSKQISDLSEKLEESNLPFKFDLIPIEDIYKPFAEMKYYAAINKKLRCFFSQVTQVTHFLRASQT